MKTFIFVLPLAIMGLSQARSQVTSTLQDSIVMQPKDLDSIPRMLSHPQLPYPTSLYATAGSGRVMLQLIVDTSGHPEVGSIGVVKGVHPELDSEAVVMVRQAVFSPGMVHGRPVRVLVQIPVEFTADSKPMRIGGPPPIYPYYLQQAKVCGSVMLTAVVDTTGHVERGSVRVIWSSNPGFRSSATTMVSRSLFRPARVAGHAVRSLIQVPVTYNIKP